MQNRKVLGKKAVVFSVLSLLLLVSTSFAADPRARKPIWNQKKSPVTRAASKEESVDLGSLNAATVRTSSSRSKSASSGSSSATSAGSNHASSGTLPNFKFYFDFLYKYRPGISTTTAPVSTHGFDSYHQLMLVEVIPSPELVFASEISTSPRYYEVDYQISPKTTIRWGKIWIPFDDMAPHNLFGGRMNTSKFFEGNEQAFLPDIWADLGVGLKYQLLDSVPLASEFHLYVVNGFRSGGTDPTGSGAPYPTFATPLTAADNNNSKAIGARLHLKFFQRLGLGVSLYRDTWTDQGTPGKGINMFGLDSQLKPSNAFELRGGLTYATVGLTATSTKASYTKGGAYLDAGYKFGEDLNWKFMIQTGVAQNDSRVRDNGDKKIVGLRLLRKIGPIEASIYVSKDLENVPGKESKRYGQFRIVTAL